ncbi:MAG: hypothetical protein Q7V43_28275 [Myxococcales bacterium]|nr:hypothetical protein [Myxococcales bacterium]
MRSTNLYCYLWAALFFATALSSPTLGERTLPLWRAVIVLGIPIFVGSFAAAIYRASAWIYCTGTPPLLPAPAPDPLATYRDGPAAECPRHPFAR